MRRTETFERQHDRAPNDARELSDFLTTESRRGNPSVAGFDLCFSPVKSVSALWALADPELAEQIEAAHTAAVKDVINWREAPRSTPASATTAHVRST